MNEGRFLADQIQRMISALIRELTDVPDTLLNKQLDFQPSNTLFQLGTHVAGSTRFWTITCLGGVDFHRDRQSEFNSTGDGPALLADLETLNTQMYASVSSLTATDLDRPVTVRTASISSFQWPGGGPFPQRHAVLHALEHTGLHVGHAQITRQLLGFQPPKLEN